VEKLSKRRYNLPNLLKKLQLTELSLVDRPANAQAMVSLFKRDTSQEELIKMTDEMEAKIKAYMDEKGVDVNKSDIPAPVLKALEEAAFVKADAELTKSAGAILPHFAEAAAKTLLKSFSEDEAIMEMLKAADAAFEASMQEFGKSDVDGEFATSADKLDSIVKSYMDENKLKKSEFAKAYAAVAKTEEGKALINKSYKGE
jgi:hypothetical protein